MESTSIIVLVLSSTPHILTIPNFVLDDIQTGDGATNKGKTKLGKFFGICGWPKFVQVLVFLVIGKSSIQNFNNMCLVELPLFSPILPNFMLINEKLYFYECISDSNPFQLDHLVEDVICFFGLLGKQSNLLLQMLQLFLSDGNMAQQLFDT